MTDGPSINLRNLRFGNVEGLFFSARLTIVMVGIGSCANIHMCCISRTWRLVAGLCWDTWSGKVRAIVYHSTAGSLKLYALRDGGYLILI